MVGTSVSVYLQRPLSCRKERWVSEKVRKASIYMHADSHACPCMHMHTEHGFYVRLARATERKIYIYMMP